MHHMCIGSSIKLPVQTHDLSHLLLICYCCKHACDMSNEESASKHACLCAGLCHSKGQKRVDIMGSKGGEEMQQKG